MMMADVLTEAQRQLYSGRLVELNVEHRDLDDVIHRLEAESMLDELQIRRLKKRKLLLKDQIAWIERQLDPDIPA
jgi:hypothetical protein